MGQGEVELENVPLRRDALRFIDTSLDVKNGLVGRVKLKIPSNLRSEPWSIVMEKVYVVVTPQCHGDYDEMQEDSITQDIKLASLDGIESEWRAKHDNEFGNTYTASSYTSWMTFKLVELQNMAVYVNVGGESFSDLSRDDLLEKMS